MLLKFKQFIRNSATLSRAGAVSFGMLVGLCGWCLGRRGSGQHLLSTFSLLRKSPLVAGRPMNVTVEPTNICNLDCPVCETGANVLGRAKGNLSIKDFQRILGQVGPYANTLMFYFMGEPFLNRHAYQMIRMAKDSGIPFIETCTNGDFVQPNSLVESGLDKVNFQIGGLTQATHEIYRINSQLERVMKNLRETICLRNEKKTPLRIEVGFILMKHNEHEIPRFQEFVQRLGADRGVVIDPCVRTLEQGKAMLPSEKKHWIYDRQAFDQGILRPKNLPQNVCPWIYYSLAIHVNGDVVPCCRDPKGEEVMGNILRQDLSAIWNGEKYRRFRERIFTRQAEVSICRLCSSYPPSQIR